MRLFNSILYFGIAIIFILKSSSSSAQATVNIAQTIEFNIKKADSLFNAEDFVQMRYYDSLSLSMAQKVNQPEYLGKVYFLHAKYLSAVQKFTDANLFYQKALQTYYKKQNNETTALIYNDWGFACGETGALDEQVEYYLLAMKIYEQRNHSVGLAQTMSNLSTAYFQLEQDKKAFIYAFKALQIREKLGVQRDLAISYTNLANMYAQKDSMTLAKKYIDLGLAAAEKSGDKQRLAQTYITKSLLLNREKKIPEALALERKAISIYEEMKNYGIAANRYIAAAFYSNMLGDSAHALQYFNKSIALASSLQNKVVMRNGYNYLSNFYLEHQNFQEAFKQYKKYISLRDSITNSETSTKIAMLQAGFDLEKRDFEINRLQTQERIRQLEIEKQKAIIKGNKAEAERNQDEINLLLKTKELQEKNLLRQQDELEKQKLLTTNNQQKLLIAEKEKIIQQKQIKSQSLIRNLLLGLTALAVLLTIFGFNHYKLKKKIEQQASIIAMRNNISENLHDDIGSSLSNISLLNQLAQNNAANTAKLDDYLVKAGEEIQHVSESINDIVWNINPRYDNIENLLVRMRRYAADMMDAKNIDYQINFSEEVNRISLNMDRRRHFYLFYKEAINNLVKHAGAHKVLVQLVVNNNNVKFEIQDDGIGFDTKNPNNGNGMATLHNRAAALNGEMEILSQPGKGTRIDLLFPVT
ncbi:ATP-binding protein [Pedobacter insulae]|uniref:histidine kinase n=1 Tax=Pedobacter insulae TaxID=414048 RepID=A0A1I2Z8K6_9SPHI|nr:ATP-binding protein [Pedobacter insulae]SFH33846.1 Histidine kinase [Pedobacter insulae]